MKNQEKKDKYGDVEPTENSQDTKNTNEKPYRNYTSPGQEETESVTEEDESEEAEMIDEEEDTTTEEQGEDESIESSEGSTYARIRSAAGRAIDRISARPGAKYAAVAVLGLMALRRTGLPGMLLAAVASGIILKHIVDSEESVEEGEYPDIE